MGKTICRLRKECGLTQTELAEKIGVSWQSVSKWETDKCVPDITLLAALAGIFKCSVDCILGIESDTYGKICEEILKKYEQCNSCQEEIELMLDALARFPNNNTFKLKLAHAYFMVFRLAQTPGEQEKAYSAAVGYCKDVIRNSNVVSEVDRAYDIFANICAESGHYEEARDACEKLSANSWWQRLYITAHIYRESKEYDELLRYAEGTMYQLFTAMRIICNLNYNGLMECKNWEKALSFCLLQERILSLFDTQESRLLLAEKMQSALQKSFIYKEMNENDKVRTSLAEMVEFARDAVEKGEKHRISENALLRSVNSPEPYMTNIVQFVNTFLDKFSDMMDEKELEKLKL